MNWNRGYTATYYGHIVDANSWRDTERFELTGGKISRTATDLRESADFDCKVKFSESWVRVYMVTEQGDSSERNPLFTGLATVPDTKWRGKVSSRRIQCYSVLKPAKDIYLQRGWYVPAGMNAGLIIRNLLQVTPAPFQIIGNPPNMLRSIVADDDETHLSMIDKILVSIGWRLRILGDGTIQMMEKATTPSARFNAIDYDIIEPEINVSDDWFDCPNVFRAIDDDMSAVARDDLPSSPLSTVNRGREIWAQDTSVTLGDHESIGEYAYRRLKEEQEHAFTVSYNRRYVPTVLVGDMVNLLYPQQEVAGDFKVLSQNVDLGFNADTAEEVCKV